MIKQTFSSGVSLLIWVSASTPQGLDSIMLYRVNDNSTLTMLDQAYFTADNIAEMWGMYCADINVEPEQGELFFG